MDEKKFNLTQTGQQVQDILNSAKSTDQVLTEIQEAMEGLPDGQAVSAQVALNTVAIQELDDNKASKTEVENDYAKKTECVFDISAYHATGTPPVLATYDDLAAALGTDGANIPEALRKGGMSVKFVHTFDNKYVQYRLMSDTFNTTEANWQGVKEEPVYNSPDLITSNAVARNIYNPKYYIVSEDNNAAFKERIASYEKGLLDVYIDSDIFPLDGLSIRCYGTTLYVVAIYNGSNIVLLTIKAEKVANGEIIWLQYNEEVIGYVVFKDKQKFLDYPTGSVGNALLNLNIVTNRHIHAYSKFITKLEVQDLESGDSDKAVSASLGKIIADTTMELIASNILDPKTITDDYYVRRNDGEPTTSSNYNITDFIEITEEGLTAINTGDMSGSYLCAACIYDANKDKVSYKDSNEGVCIIDPTGHSDWKYARFNLKKSIPEGSGYAVYRRKTLTTPSYIEYGKPVYKQKTDESTLLQLLSDNDFYTNKVQISLPDKMWAVRGDTLQVFFQGIVVVPNTNNYDIVVECSKGKSLYRYWVYDVPSNAALGNFDWTIKVKDQNGNILGSKTCQLVVVDKAAEPVSAKNVLCIGDSLTSGGIWPSEMKRRLTGTVGSGTPAALGLENINFIGRKSVIPTDMIQVNLEGNSGWSWTDYDDEGRPRYRFYLDGIYDVHEDAKYINNGKTYTVIEVNNESGKTVILTSASAHGNTITGTTLTKSSGSGDSTLTFTFANEEGANPFWDNNENKLSFVNYVENICNLPAGTTIDYAYILMTWNGVPNSVNDEDWETFMSQAMAVIDALHADYPSCKIKLMSVEFVYTPTFRAATSTQDGFMNIRRIAKMNELYQDLANSNGESGASGDAYNTFLEFVNVSSQFDSMYNMTNSESNVNTRNSDYKERRTNNSIHPGKPGYLQIADVAYRNICKELT